jgi:hypothetical protein
MYFRLIQAGLLAITLFFFAASSHADDWKPIADRDGVAVSYEAVGNIARIRFANANPKPVSVSWQLQVRLATGTVVENRGELALTAGDSQVVASGPYRDGGHPAEVKSISGTVTTANAAR